MERFDEIIKAKLEQVQPTYSESAWYQLEQKLPLNGNGNFRKPLIAGIAANIAIVLILSFATDLRQDENDAMGFAPRETFSITTNETSTDAMENHHLGDEPMAGRQPEEKTNTGTNVVITPSSSQVPLSEAPTASRKKDGIHDTAPSNKNLFATTDGPTVPNEEPSEYEPAANVGLHILASGTSCIDNPMLFKVGEPSLDMNYKWSVNGKISQGISLRTAFNRPGQHTVEVSSYKNGELVATASKKIEIEQPLKPTIGFEASYRNNCFGADVSLSTAASTTAKWFINGYAVGSGNEISAFVSEPKADILLEITSDKGCSYREKISRDLTGGTRLYTSTSFSPDGNGTNDTWFPVGLKEHNINSRLEIRNAHTGKKVFETSTGQAWDGSINGTVETARENDQFQWILIATDRCGTTIEKAGNLIVKP